MENIVVLECVCISLALEGSQGLRMKGAFVVKSDGWAKMIGLFSDAKTFCSVANWLLTVGSWRVAYTCSRGVVDSSPRLTGL